MRLHFTCGVYVGHFRCLGITYEIPWLIIAANDTFDDPVAVDPAIHFNFKIYRQFASA